MFLDDEDQTSILRARRLLAQMRIAIIAALSFVVTLAGLTVSAHADTLTLSNVMMRTDRDILMIGLLFCFVVMAVICAALWRRGYKDVVNAERQRRGH